MYWKNLRRKKKTYFSHAGHNVLQSEPNENETNGSSLDFPIFFLFYRYRSEQSGRRGHNQRRFRDQHAKYKTISQQKEKNGDFI